ncbi:3-isopropylmalate dehydratase small subunit [Fictibacillus gelatini]|uniref:3-isopropylmalate dehydratase small subunit n=1 Tax=Fictibacillus gelatini TaxID=225985 RepID=UPI000415C491|nr:3-isopropylmalate dehydratase small subunit [Fictibacillus gelatini]
MRKFKTFTGKPAVLDRVNVDTDQIIPKQFLKRIEKSGYGQFLFFDWRFDDQGKENKEFELNKPQAQGANILVTGPNFGCGSSREHAPWALKDYGIDCIIAPSFADIFYNNCLKNGILVIKLPEEVIKDLMQRANASDYQLTVNLSEQEISDGQGFNYPFDFDPYWKEMLMNGWDEISLTLKHEDAILRYEETSGVL